MILKDDLKAIEGLKPGHAKRIARKILAEKGKRGEGRQKREAVRI